MQPWRADLGEAGAWGCGEVVGAEVSEEAESFEAFILLLMRVRMGHRFDII